MNNHNQGENAHGERRPGVAGNADEQRATTPDPVAQSGR